MDVIEWIFWISFIGLFYAYIGYPLLLYLLSYFYPTDKASNTDLLTVAHIIAAYNEEEIIEEKIRNSLALNYPDEKLQTIIVSDGSNDKTGDIIRKFDKIIHFHENARGGKIKAIQRILPNVNSEILVFSDANAMLNQDALKNLVTQFENKNIGAVAGEKIVLSETEDNATGSGESIYWKYESFIKSCEAKVSSTVGAAGELYAVRRNLFHFPQDAVYVEDMISTLNVTTKGFKVGYAHNAVASEHPSDGIREEMKRKVRISARGVRTIPMLIPYLNPFKFGWTSLFLFSHKILRWTFTPMALICLFISSYFLRNENWLTELIFTLQILFYILSIIGFLFSHKQLKIKILFIPFYFSFIHICAILGYVQLFSGNTNPLWERSKRKSA